MDDLHDRLERLADRVSDRPELLRDVERVKARRSLLRRVGTGVLALALGLAAIVGLVRAFDRSARVVPIASDQPPQPMKTYENPLGWSIDVPADWFVQPIDGFNGRFSLSGAALSNEPITPGGESSGSLPDLSTLSRDGVMLIVTHREGGPPPSIEDDSMFPLDPDDASIMPGPSPVSSVLRFRGDGIEFTAQYGGYADGDPKNIRTLERAITTIRFQPWELGDVRNGFEAVAADLPEGTGQPGLVNKIGLIYVMKFGGETYVLDVPDVSCEGQNQAWDAPSNQILLEGPCYEDIRYDPDGSPDPMNAPAFQQILDRHPVIRAHDGTPLVALDVVVGGAA
jgi:hypothetical protein